jgi:hypothetical protein
MNGYFTPTEAFLIAETLHNEGKFDAYIWLRHAQPFGPKYVGDDERRAGKTATVSVQLENDDRGIDEIVAIRDKIRKLGYDSEWDSTQLTILGKWHGDVG